MNRQLPWIASVLFFLPMVFLTVFYSVNVPTWDQWSYFDKIFGDPASMFFFQYLHHRMGVGGLVIWVTSRLTHLDICATN